MRNLTLLRYRLAVIFCLITILSCGCAVYPYQLVQADLLEQKKSKTFKLGIVKIQGAPDVGFRGLPNEYKKRALDNIPISEICSILTRRYSVTIDANLDKTIRAIIEKTTTGKLNFEVEKSPEIFYLAAYIAAGLLLPSTEDDTPNDVYNNDINDYVNIYYGNLDYANKAVFEYKNNEEFPDIVNVTYSLDFGLTKISFYYDIDFRSSEQDIINLRVIVGSIKTTDDKAAVWDSYVDHAGRISEALKRDLFKDR